MEQLLGFVLLSFIITALLMVPFIDLLFTMRRRFKKTTDSGEDLYNSTYNSLMRGKDVGTPVGGGLLVIPAVVILSTLALYFTHHLNLEWVVLLITILSFGFIGFLDDIRKIFWDFKKTLYPGIRGRYIFALQAVSALGIGYLLYSSIGLDNIFVPIFGNIVLGLWYIPLAAFLIVSFSNAFNITDGLDGLSCGLLLICLIAFLALANSVFNPTLAIFVGVWIGALIAFLYFNVHPARIYLGDAGAYGFGATLAVIGLLTGKTLGLAVIGGVYIVVILTSVIQIISKKYFHKKVFPIAPIHLLLRHIGWEEPKVVVRMWLAGAVFAIFGLWLALLSA